MTRLGPETCTSFNQSMLESKGRWDSPLEMNVSSCSLLFFLSLHALFCLSATTSHVKAPTQRAAASASLGPKGA